MEYKELQFENIKYLIRYPNGYKEGEKYPTILHLHGAGSRGFDLNVICNGTFCRLTEAYEDFPFVAVMPQCNENTWFDHFDALKRFSKMIAGESFCDPTRFYLMGLSMGGYATWQLGMSCPELFAAMIPICGGGMSWNADRLKAVPVWAFHGGKDTTVYPDESEHMVKRVNDFGGSAKLTVYPEAYHDAWTPTYQNYEVFLWLLSQQKKKKVALKDDRYNDAEEFG